MSIAMGDLMFYGRADAARRGEYYAYVALYRRAGSPRKTRFRSSSIKTKRCVPSISTPSTDSGYLRDRNVFGDNVTIEDTMSITARYRNQVILTYSLIAYSPWEGYRVAITGDKGRLELEVIDQVGRVFVAGQEETVAHDRSDRSRVRRHTAPHLSHVRSPLCGGDSRWPKADMAAETW